MIRDFARALVLLLFLLGLMAEVQRMDEKNDTVVEIQQ